MKSALRTHVAAALLLVPIATAFVTEAAAAQVRVVVAQPAIGTISLAASHGLAPGSRLSLQLQATPGARFAEVALGSSGIRVPLREQWAGHYVGDHVLRRGDFVDPYQRMTARATWGDRTVAVAFAYPAAIQALAMGAPGQLEIERFVMRPAGRIEPGRELRFRLVGEPNARAWLDIPGVVRGLEMEESRPGIYTASYTVRRRDDPDQFRRAVASLQKGDRRVTARVDLRGRGDDERAPLVGELTPRDGDRVGERGRTQISARLTDDASGIDRDSIRLRVDGRDVTARARIDADEIDYRENLQPGRHTAELVVGDRAGNVTRRTWAFEVVAGDRVAVDPRALPLHITSHANNAVLDSLGDFVLHGRTAPFARVHLVVETVAGGSGANLRQQVADYTVQADPNGFFNARVEPRGLPLPGMRYEVRLTSTTEHDVTQERLTLYPRRG